MKELSLIKSTRRRLAQNFLTRPLKTTFRRSLIVFARPSNLHLQVLKLTMQRTLRLELRIESLIRLKLRSMNQIKKIRRKISVQKIKLILRIYLLELRFKVRNKMKIKQSVLN